MSSAAPAIEIHLPEREADVRRWFAGRQEGETVKRNSGRTVWRVAGDPPLYVKRFRRAIFRDRARREAQMLRVLADAGIPCPRVVATGRDRSATYLVTEEVTGARPLEQELRAGAGGSARPLLSAFADLLRRLHDAGLEHLDLHAGNVLCAGAKLVLIDVHRFRRGAPLSPARRRRGIAFALLSFYESVPTTDSLRFIRAYGARDRDEILEAWEELRRLQFAYYAHREKRCLTECSEFGRRNGVFYRKGALEEADLERLASGAEAAGLRLKFLPAGEARRLWRNGHALFLRGVPTPRLHACGPGWLALEEPPSVSLEVYARETYAALGRAARDEALFRLARLFRRMHERGVDLPGLDVRRVRVRDSSSFFVEHPDPARLSRSVPEARRRAALERLAAGLPATVTRADRLRFFRGYCGRDAALWGRRREWFGGRGGRR